MDTLGHLQGLYSTLPLIAEKGRDYTKKEIIIERFVKSSFYNCLMPLDLELLHKLVSLEADLLDRKKYSYSKFVEGSRYEIRFDCSGFIFYVKGLEEKPAPVFISNKVIVFLSRYKKVTPEKLVIDVLNHIQNLLILDLNEEDFNNLGVELIPLEYDILYHIDLEDETIADCFFDFKYNQIGDAFNHHNFNNMLHTRGDSIGPNYLQHKIGLNNIECDFEISDDTLIKIQNEVRKFLKKGGPSINLVYDRFIELCLDGTLKSDEVMQYDFILNSTHLCDEKDDDESFIISYPLLEHNKVLTLTGDKEKDKDVILMLFYYQSLLFYLREDIILLLTSIMVNDSAMEREFSSDDEYNEARFQFENLQHHLVNIIEFFYLLDSDKWKKFVNFMHIFDKEEYEKYSELKLLIN